MKAAGVSVFRLNFSHGEQGQKAELIGIIGKVSHEWQQAVAILADLQGPKSRADVSSSLLNSDYEPVGKDYSSYIGRHLELD